MLKHACMQTPHLDALAADGVGFRHHYAQAAPCGPSRACLFTGLYMHNHRSVRNGTPLDHRHATLAQDVRALGYDPVLFGYTDTSADPRLYAARDPLLTTYEGVLPGMRAVVPSSAEIPYGWRSDLRAKGYAVSRTTPRDIFRPVRHYPGAAQRGATFAPPVYAAADGDTAFLTNAVLTHFAEQPDRPWFIHVSYLRPHPPFITPDHTTPCTIRRRCHHQYVPLPQPWRLSNIRCWPTIWPPPSNRAFLWKAGARWQH